jgi:hypothetical protein
VADLLEDDFGLAEKATLYRCLDKLVEHKDALFKFLVRRWGELFGAKFDVLLYDLTSTYSRPTKTVGRMTCASSATAATSEATAGKSSSR